jgi:sortase A
MVFAGVALVLVSVGLVFADVREAGDAVPAAPKDRALTLTVPSMKRVKDVPVYGGPAQDESALHNGTLHVNDTGFPWEREANVYIAGHRLGYPRTESFLVFWDLNELKRGKRVLLEDSEGTRYVYRVFDRRIVGPDDVSVKKPIEGKNIVSLQTCTLPDYKDRLVVQAELVKTAKAPVRQAAEGGDLPARSG